jgi:tetratricopeptide (TPR) repeat protein
MASALLELLRRKPYLAVLVAVFAGALGAGYGLLPGAGERIAMLERDGRYTAALELLERRYAAGDHSQRIVYQLQTLYEHFGDLAKARSLLEQLAEQRPRDAQVQRRLALFYKQTQDETAYIRALRSQLDARYNEAACRELIGLLRGRGEHDGEQRAIQECRARGYRRSDDIVRLAGLVAADGDIAQASVLLRSVDDLRRLKSLSERLMLFTALMEIEQPREAQRRAIRWIKGSRDDFLALTIVEMLTDDKRHDLAIELARETGSPGDGVSLAIAEVMLDRSQSIAARSYLRGWLEQAEFESPSVARRFILAALDVDDPALAYEGARRYGLEKLGQSELVNLAEALAASEIADGFAAVRARLAPETLAANPLIGAAVELDQGAPDATRRLLTGVKVQELDAWRLALWARLMEQTGRTTAASATLRDLGVVRAEAEATRRPPRPLAARKALPTARLPQTAAVAAAPKQVAATAPTAGPPVATKAPGPPAVKALRRPTKERRIRARPLVGVGAEPKQAPATPTSPFSLFDLSPNGSPAKGGGG